MEEALDGSQAGASATDVSGPGHAAHSLARPSCSATARQGSSPRQGHLKGTVLAAQRGLPEQTAAVLASRDSLELAKQQAEALERMRGADAATPGAALSPRSRSRTSEHRPCLYEGLLPEFACAAGGQAVIHRPCSRSQTSEPQYALQWLPVLSPLGCACSDLHVQCFFAGVTNWQVSADVTLRAVQVRDSQRAWEGSSQMG